MVITLCFPSKVSFQWQTTKLYYQIHNTEKIPRFAVVTIYVTIYVEYESQESLECHFIVVIIQEILKSCHVATLICDLNDDIFPH